MDSDQDRQSQYLALQEKISQLEVSLQKLASILKGIEASNIDADTLNIQRQDALATALGNSNLNPPTSYGLQRFIQTIHDEHTPLEINSGARNSWEKFVLDASGDITEFFRPENLANAASIGIIEAYLGTFWTALNKEINKLQKELDSTVTKTESSSTNVVPVTEKNKSETQLSAEDKIKTQQRESVLKAKTAYLNQKLTEINKLLPPGKELKELDLQNILFDAEVSSYSSINTKDILDKLIPRLHTNDPKIINEVNKLFLSQRQEFIDTRKQAGLSTKVLPQEAKGIRGAIDATVKSPINGLATQVFATKGSEISDPIALEIRDTALKAVWEGNLIERATGRTTRKRRQFIEDLGIIDMPKDFKELRAATNEMSYLDMFGVEDPNAATQAVETGQTPQPVVAPPTNPKTLAKAKRNIENLQKTANVIKFLATNPAALGAAGVGVGLGIMVAGVLSRASAFAAIGGGIAGASAGALLGGAIGTIVPVIGTAVGAAVGGVIGGISGAAIGYNLVPTGLNTAIATSAGQGLGAATAAVTPIGTSAAFQATTAASNALTTTSALLQGMSALPSGFTGASALATIAGPPALIAGIAGLVVVPTYLGNLFLVPSDQGPDQSKYITVTKIADVEKSDHPQKITYNIEIKPKKGYTIHITDITDTFHTSSKNTLDPKPEVLHDPNPEISPAKGKTLSEADTFTTSYSVPFNNTYEDTRISNTLSVTFDVSGTETKTAEKFLSVAVVVFGNPPIDSDMGCFEFMPGGETGSACGDTANTYDWTETEKQTMAEAFGVTAQYPTYRSLLCDKGKIQLYRGPKSSYGGCASPHFPSSTTQGVIIYDLGIQYGVLNARYTIIHESGHIIYWRNGDLFKSFMSNVIGNEKLLATYSYPTSIPNGEDFAETFGLFSIFRQKTFSVLGRKVDMPNEYPIHYNWVKTNVFDNMSEPQ